MRAMQYIQVGYQKILTFECRSGGFNWWEGDNPGNLILSAMALMMLRDTAEVFPAVDENVINRSYRYLVSLQQGDGSFKAETHLHAGNENLGQDTLRATCYAAWALNASGFAKEEPAQKAMNYIGQKVGTNNDLYTMAMCANALATAPRKPDELMPLLARIDQKVKTDDQKMRHFEPEGRTMVNSGGIAANVELTALVALAYMEAGYKLGDVPAMIQWMASTKDPNGNWGYNTQASVLALKAFIKMARIGTDGTNADISITINNSQVAQKHFDDSNKDVMWQVDIPSSGLADRNAVSMTMTGKGSLSYQVIPVHFLPAQKAEGPKQALEVSVDYDRTRLKVDETLTVKVSVKKNDPEANGMVLLTVGVPPGFDVLTEDLELLKGQKAIRNWELTGRAVIIYLDGVPDDARFSMDFRMKARMPVKASTGDHEVRLYYDAERRATDTASEIVVE